MGRRLTETDPGTEKDAIRAWKTTSRRSKRHGRLECRLGGAVPLLLSGPLPMPLASRSLDDFRTLLVTPDTHDLGNGQARHLSLGN